MRRFRAALYKDLRLFFGGAGAVSLLLPFVLLAGLLAGSGDVSVSVKPFPVAVRDEDNTVMSRSLISQMDRVGMFSEVRLIPEGTSDSQALENGSAAAVTIPKDLFYALYRMDSEPVSVTLNSSMPLESALFNSVFSSVMDIIKSNQAASKGLYRFCYGSLNPSIEDDMYSESAANLVMDALSRQSVFDMEAEQSDIQGALVRKTAACVLSTAAMFFALASVKTIPEELRLGVIPRYTACGGNTDYFVLAKLLTVMFLSLPVALLFSCFFGFEALIISLCLIFTAFGVMLAAAVFAGEPASALRFGNLLILLSLVSALWPNTGFAMRLTLPYYARMGLEALNAQMGIAGALRFLFPAILAGAAGLAIGVRKLGCTDMRAASEAPDDAVPAVQNVTDTPVGMLSGTAARLMGLSQVKLFAMSGGAIGLALLIAAALIGGFAANGAGQGKSLKLTVCDLDNSRLSQELVQRLESQEGVTVTPSENADIGTALLEGSTEGLLIIENGYADSLASNSGPKLHYEASSSSSSADGAREIISGQAVSQKSRERAAVLAEEKTGHTLSDGEYKRLSEYIAESEALLNDIYVINTEKGAGAAAPFMPGAAEFAALAVLLTLLTAAPWSGMDGRSVEFRMLAFPNGWILSFGSGCLALTALGFIIALAALILSLDLYSLFVFAVYSFCCATLSAALTRLTAVEGRIDTLAPFMALLLCLIGGCFIDFSQFSTAVQAMSWITPPGLALKASGGNVTALLSLAAEGFLFAFSGIPRQK